MRWDPADSNISTMQQFFLIRAQSVNLFRQCAFYPSALPQIVWARDSCLACRLARRFCGDAAKVSTGDPRHAFGEAKGVVAPWPTGRGTKPIAARLAATTGALFLAILPSCCLAIC